MDFEFSDTQKQLGETAARLFARAATSTDMRASLRRDPDGHDHALWSQMAELGFLGISIPEAYGGLGLGDLDLCVVAEAAGRNLIRAPVASSLYGFAEALIRLGDEAVKQNWLPAIASGEKIGAFLDASDLHGVAFDFDAGRLSGFAPAVADGMAADGLVILTANSAWLIDLAGTGIHRTRVETIDPLRPFARIELEAVEAIPLAGADIPSARAAIRDRMAVLIAFEQIGGADVCLETAVAYAKERKAFGREIGSFQAVKRLLADMYVATTLARSNAWRAGWALTEDPSVLPEAAAAARISATAAYRQCAADAIQVHGGIGFTWELDCHFHYRRASQLALALGDMRDWEDQLIDALTQSRRPTGDA